MVDGGTGRPLSAITPLTASAEFHGAQVGGYLYDDAFTRNAASVEWSQMHGCELARSLAVDVIHTGTFFQRN